ncbi:hypothetical protein ACGFX4_27125 [Kitasatospora sp. NPDC048365]|uniref:hypothetical protein n=1 Tax=Kitasatospora sp. NPDC048365 TaxID=3364050 RepID=UPI00371EE729
MVAVIVDDGIREVIAEGTTDHTGSGEVGLLRAGVLFLASQNHSQIRSNTLGPQVLQ